MKLSLPERSQLVAAFWKDAASVCPSHEVPMRSFFVDRVYKPQVVMVCPKGEMFRFAQKPKQIESYQPRFLYGCIVWQVHMVRRIKVAKLISTWGMNGSRW